MTSWRYPSAADLAADVTPEQFAAIKARIGGGLYRASEQAKDWAGFIVAEVLDVDARGEPAQKRRVAAMLRAWTEAGHFEVQMRRDPARREQMQCLVVAGAQPE